MILRPSIFSDKQVIAFQSTRLNDNFDLIIKSLTTESFMSASSKQVHGNKVLRVNESVFAEGYDALISNKKNVFVSVSTADCVPVLIYDTCNNAVAAIHAGWRGTCAKIVNETLIAMNNNFGTKGSDCLAFIGACISEKVFEVGEDVACFFEDDVKQWNILKKKFLIDLKKENKKQLMLFGVKENNIEVSEYCTFLNNDLFYSYRKENGKTGRMFSAIAAI